MRQKGKYLGIWRTNAVSIELALLLITGLVGSVAQSVNINSSHESVVAKLVQADALAKLAQYMDTTSASLDPRARTALIKIEGTDRQLLALRGYLRSEGNLSAKWSWTAEEIKRFEGSAEYRAALNEVEKVQRKFAELNPGYELYVNTQVRTLERQISLWNETKSVRAAAEHLLMTALHELNNSSYKETPDASSINRFRQFLKSYKLTISPTVATPGLSQHGQLRAFDFQVQRGGQLVAGTDSASIDSVWEAQGWAKKLNAAVLAASNKFKGPLLAPREPWHYEYVH